MDSVVEGIVVVGDRRGLALGFPTANVRPEQAESQLEDGVYAGYATRADGSRYVAAISVGRRPTYYDDEAPIVVEAHLLDFEGDLYGERLRVEINERLRGQLRFTSEEELKRQMADDVAAVRASTASIGESLA